MTKLAYVRIGIDRILELPDGQFVIGIAEEVDTRASADVLDLRRIDIKVGKRIKPGPRGQRLRADGPERTIATVIRAATPLNRAEADDALRQWKGDRENSARWTSAAIAVVNRAIQAHRIAWRDPYATELTTEDLWLARLGVADAQTLASGGAGEEIDVLPTRRVRESSSDRAKPGEIMANALSGTLELFEGEELLALATREINHDRLRSAAGAVIAARDVLAGELPPDGPRTAVAEALAGAMPQAASDLLAAIEEAQDALDGWRNPPEELVSHQLMRLPSDETGAGR
jgi:hypothetical protein